LKLVAEIDTFSTDCCSLVCQKSGDSESVGLAEDLNEDNILNIEGKVLKANSSRDRLMKKCLEHIFEYLDLKTLSSISEVRQSA